jgi:2-phosphosulfolactate phosphatase
LAVRVIDVALTPDDSRPADTAVVIDVLRATSTVTQALAAGYLRVLCTDSIERALALRAPGRVLAGERGGVMPSGFDQGNSPQEAAMRRGAELVLATTNGAPAIATAARHAGTALLACMLNLDAVVSVLRSSPDCDLQIVCSGTDGEAALEDAYIAGRISAALDGPRSDAALIAEAVARGFDGPLPALASSADARMLQAVGLEHDIPYCARDSVLAIVPVAVVHEDGVAAVVDLGRAAATSEERASGSHGLPAGS